MVMLLVNCVCSNKAQNISLLKQSGMSLYMFGWNRYKSRGSSQRWIERQTSDFYSKKSLADGYRSRAAYKLLEINNKFKVINKFSKNIVDLGFAPGAWTQVVLNQAKEIESTPKILGIDLLHCAAPTGSHFIQGDIFSRRTHQSIIDFFEGEGAHLVLSDMMSNSTGSGEQDHYASMEICEGVLMLTDRLLKRKGALVMKFFTGSLDSDLRKMLETRFKNVHIFKPKACRNGLRETYFVALGKRREKGEIVGTPSTP